MYLYIKFEAFFFNFSQQCTVFWHAMLCSQSFPIVSEERTASIIKVKSKPRKQPARRKPTKSSSPF
jgi:hypothetical protein